jgi:N4-gp56 family major capsid protein
MAFKSYALNDPLAQQLWADRLMAENFANTRWTKFIGEEDALVNMKSDFQKGIGSQITFGLRLQLDQAGSLDNELLESNEGHYETVTDSLVIRQLRFAVEGTGAIDRQRIGFDDREQVRMALTDLWTRRDEEMFFNQLCGAAWQTDVRRTGLNTVHDPGPHGANDTTHYLCLGAANEQSLGSSNVFSTDHIDYCVERAKRTATPPIRALRIEGGEYYCMFIHTFCAQDLRNNVNWKNAQIAAMQGGAINNNPLFTGALGVWNNTIVYESDYVSNGVSASDGSQLVNVRRCVFGGAQSMVLGYGKAGGSQKAMFWREREIDYGNRLGVAAGKIYGLKASTYDFNQNGTSQRFGTIVVPVYAAAHS